MGTAFVACLTRPKYPITVQDRQISERSVDGRRQIPTDKKSPSQIDGHCVRAMFGSLARATMKKLDPRSDAHVVDIACGTGALTRVIAETLHGKGRIVGVNLNETMLDVAQAN